MSKLQEAINYCKKKHDDAKQVRKYTKEPYWVHCLEVMGLVKEVTDNESMLIASLLHDVVEDTPTTLTEIREKFGIEVMHLVEQLSDISRKSDGNRQQRKALDLKHTELACSDAKTIKLADLISNGKDIVKHDLDFAIIYLKEKERLLEVLKEGNSELYQKAQNVLEEGKKAIYEKRSRKA